jgi:hypothetical protein
LSLKSFSSLGDHFNLVVRLGAKIGLLSRIASFSDLWNVALFAVYFQTPEGG